MFKVNFCNSKLDEEEDTSLSLSKNIDEEEIEGENLVQKKCLMEETHYGEESPARMNKWIIFLTIYQFPSHLSPLVKITVHVTQNY